jgi:hypothetical protein
MTIFPFSAILQDEELTQSRQCLQNKGQVNAPIRKKQSIKSHIKNEQLFAMWNRLKTTPISNLYFLENVYTKRTQVQSNFFLSYKIFLSNLPS